MMVEITSVRIGEEKIEIEALAIEKIILADNLFEDVEVPVVNYEFDRKARNGAEMKYLWKVCESKAKCREQKSMGKMLENLKGVITQLSDSFKV